MKESSYRDRDYAFGEAIFTLRSRIGLTQLGLANFLGISRRAISDWEAGNSYPKPEHLKALISLGIEQQAFRLGKELEDVRLLWHASHQKVLLDEAWLEGVLISFRALSTPGSAADGPRVDWG